MVRKLFFVVILLFIVLFISAILWRWRIPEYKGQNLRIDQSAPESFEILLLGDMGSGDESQARVADAMEKYCASHSLAGVVFLGDNFYPKGVSSTDDPQWKAKFLNMYDKDCLKTVPFFSILGNHDYKGNAEAQIQFKSEAPAWHMPHRFFEVAFGSRLQLIMIDSNYPDLCGLPSICALDFLRQSLGEGNFADRIVVAHHPLISSSQKYKGQEFRGMVIQQMVCDKATTYISGHSHHLEHRQLKDCRTDAFISGGGGAGLYQVNSEDPDSYFTSSKNGFLSLKVVPGELHFTFYDPWLDPLYSYVRRKP